MSLQRTDANLRGGLDRRSILQAAVAVVDEAGLDGLNMRAVANKLNAGTMSLYHHVPGKDALLDGIAELVLSEIEVPGPERGEWPQRAVALAQSFYEVCRSHPHAIPVLVTRTFNSEAALTPCEAALGLLAEAGFAPEEALVAFRTILAFCLGFVTMEAGGFFGGGGHSDRGIRPDHDPDFLRQRGLDRLAEATPYLDGRNLTADFDTGLGMVLTGVLATAPPAV